MWGQDWGSTTWGAAASVPSIAPWGMLLLAACFMLLGASLSLRRGRRLTALILGLLVAGVPLAARALSLPFTFSNGTIADATQVNANFETLRTAVSKTGWVKIYDEVYNANGTQTISITPVNNTFTVRVLFAGVITGCCGSPSEIYLRTSGGGSSGYNSFIGGETLGSASVFSASPVQPGFILGRATVAGNTVLSFDYELTELSGSGAIGHGAGAAHPVASNTTTLFRAGGNNPYPSSSSSLTIQFWNASNVSGRFTVLQLM